MPYKVRFFLLFLSLIVFFGLSLRAETELVGPITREEILGNLPEWNAVVASYQPNPEVISKLQGVSGIVRIEVILGTWCPDSKEHVSAFFKILDMTDNPFFQVEYIGIPEDKDARAPYVEGKNIDKVPTFIVFVDGQEKGRIVEHPQDSLERDLLQILLR
ncbi:MAG: thioredoxin family protein [Candidatus Aminicenantales bacterium]